MVVVPGFKPKTNPLASTMAIDGLLLLHAPPLPVVNNWVTVPAHMEEDPVMVPALAPGLTLTV
jgi:hypothetical protein